MELKQKKSLKEIIHLKYVFVVCFFIYNWFLFCFCFFFFVFFYYSNIGGIVFVHVDCDESDSRGIEESSLPVTFRKTEHVREKKKHCLISINCNVCGLLGVFLLDVDVDEHLCRTEKKSHAISDFNT